MNIEVLIAVALGVAVFAATPGPALIASVSKAVSGGFKESLFFIGGVVSGDVIFLLLAIWGLSAISQVMGEVFFVVKIVGGIYLVILGIKLFKEDVQLKEQKELKNKNRLNTVISGFLVTSGNPKPIIFYASVLPAIVDVRDINAIDALIISLTVESVAFLVLGTYCYLASFSKKLLKTNTFHKKANKVAGSLMCATGCYVIVM